jgi:hypothetical protein
MAEPRPVDHEVARAGLEAAAAVVERMLELGRRGASGIQVPIAPNQGAPSASTEDDPSAAGAPSADLTKMSRRLRADAERLVELYATWTRALVDGAAALAEQAMERSPTSAAPSEGSLRLGPAARGTTTGGEAWLHVLDGPPGPPARVHASDLIAHHGDRIPAELVVASPGVLDTAASRTSTAVAISVAVPDRIRPGTYYGHLLADGLPEVVLPLVVEVVS